MQWFDGGARFEIADIEFVDEWLLCIPHAGLNINAIW